MSMIDTHRAAYNRPNITLGKRENLSPTVTVEKRVTYSVKIGDKTRICSTIAQVNAILAVNPSCKVVKSTRTTTIETRHERIK